MSIKLRIGRRVGRTIYIQRGEEPSDEDSLVGLVDTRDLAQLIVEAVNGRFKPPTIDEEMSHNEDDPVLPSFLFPMAVVSTWEEFDKAKAAGVPIEYIWARPDSEVTRPREEKE